MRTQHLLLHGHITYNDSTAEEEQVTKVILKERQKGREAGSSCYYI